MGYYCGTVELAEKYIAALRPTAADVTDAHRDEWRLPREFDTPEAKAILDGLCNLNYARRNGVLYDWIDSNALFGYMVLKTSEKLNIRHDNNRLPWNKYQYTFNMSDSQIRTAKNVVSKISHEQQCEPTGYDDIDRLCK